MNTVPGKKIPVFETDEQAAEFWETHDFADYAEATEAVAAVSFAPLPLKQVCLRLSPTQIECAKRIAASKGIGYQTLLRMWIAERMRQETRAT